MQVGELNFVIKSGTSGSVGYSASNLTLPTGSSWKVHHNGRPATLVLKLEKKSLLWLVKLHNLRTSEVTIWIALQNRKSQYIKVTECQKLAHDRVQDIGMGYLPCRFIKLRCNSPGPYLSMKCIQLMGLEMERLSASVGPRLNSLICDQTKENLFADDEETKVSWKGKGNPFHNCIRLPAESNLIYLFSHHKAYIQKKWDVLR